VRERRLLGGGAGAHAARLLSVVLGGGARGCSKATRPGPSRSEGGAAHPARNRSRTGYAGSVWSCRRSWTAGDGVTPSGDRGALLGGGDEGLDAVGPETRPVDRKSGAEGKR